MIPNRGAINDTQGWRELIHISIYHYKYYFQNVIKPLKKIAMRSPLGTANCICLL